MTAAAKRPGLETHMKHTLAQLSGDWQQRAAISNLADEPTGDLDITITIHMTELLREIGAVETAALDGDLQLRAGVAGTPTAADRLSSDPSNPPFDIRVADAWGLPSRAVIQGVYAHE
jgi:hypothetical protein